MKLIKMKLISGQKKYILSISIILIVFLIVFSYSFNHGKKKHDYIKSFIGKTIIIGKDTLIITNYNYKGYNYNLSNKVIIDEDYVFKNAK